MLAKLLLKMGTAMAFGLALVTTTQTALAAGEHSVATHRLVLQISSADPGVQHLVLNNAVNVKKQWGDDVDVVVVAYGPGLSMLIPNKTNKEAKRVASLSSQGIAFDACHNTMMGIKKKTGKMPSLIKGVKVVPAGLVRIIELQEKGYSYVRP